MNRATIFQAAVLAIVAGVLLALTGVYSAPVSPAVWQLITHAGYRHP
ncbi:hypothetical protein AB0C42_33685 [Micromonospora taraxaci]